ncbi:MAG: hypothetical protein GY805_15340 [Chloroflexi bacterium]|nr:hypothetical protein [Chloroflexota bacterium]
MKWKDIRKQYPSSWLLIEAIEAHTTSEKRRIVDSLAVIDQFGDFYVAMDSYKHLHREKPEKEMYVIHTDSEEINIKEQNWAGIRSGV